MENDLLFQSKVAIIGMAGKFPQAANIHEFWNHLIQGVEGIQFFSKDELRMAGVDPALLDKPEYVPASGRLQDIEMFDAAFFQYTPREAEIMDPQQRLFLECAWNAVEDAGHCLSGYEGAVGVFAGVGANKYLTHIISRDDLLQILDHRQIEVANDKDFLTTRVSYKLNATGPSLAVQTACSSSLVSVHMACQSLLNGECDMALAGGVSIQFLEKHGYLYKEGGIESPDGHCRCFDEKAEGTVFGDGVGVIVLKRLEEALADKDHIYAVISGSAINNDGAGKIGFTAPSFDGQVQVISEAMEVAGVTPHEIGYVEAHGTGTKLGDKVEIAALREVFKDRDPADACYIGSVKANVGHLNTASGIAGLIKTVLAIKHKQIPPLLHLQKPNPQLELEKSPFRLNQRTLKWETGERKRVAGVSSFGIGGTNAHVIIEEAPFIRSQVSRKAWHLLPISGKTEQAKQRNVENMLAYLKANPDVDLSQVSYTLQTGREHFDYRGFLLCNNKGEYQLVQPENKGVKEEKTVVFFFTCKGTSYGSMALELYQHVPFFQETMDENFQMVKRMFQLDLKKLAYPDEEDPEQIDLHGSKTNDDSILTFILAYSLAKLWRHWGVSPKVMAGDAIGEYVCACLANVLTREDALKLLFFRGDVSEKMVLGKPTIPFLSNLTKTWIEEGQATSLDYWKEVINQPSSLFACVPELAKIKNPIFLEIGPQKNQHDLLAMAIQENNQSVPWLYSLPGESENKSTYQVLLHTLGKLWAENVPINWKNVRSSEQPNRIPLPTYAFEREAYWIERAVMEPVDILATRKQHDQQFLMIQQGDRFHQVGNARYMVDSTQMRQIEALLASFSSNLSESTIEMNAIDRGEELQTSEQKKEYVVSTLCHILEELLGKSPIVKKDDFFDLGGDSVTAIQFASRAKDFNIVFSSDLLFDYPTIEQLVAKIHEEPETPLQEETLPTQSVGINYYDVEKTDQDILAEVLSAEEVESVYPLSFMQLLVLNHNIINARLGTVNLISFQIFEELQRENFRMAWQKVVNRHTLLRTGFIWRRITNPIQFVKKQVDITIQELDWTNLSEEGQQSALAEFLSLERKKGFKVDEVPQMRFHLIKLRDACYQFVWSYQNSLFDGWSMNIIFQEVWENYEKGEFQKSLPETVTTPFLAYMQWQKTKDTNEAKAFWTEELQQFHVEAQHKQTNETSPLKYEGAFHSVDIPLSDVHAARDFCRKHQVTLNTLFIGAWGLAHANMLKQQDVMIGMITSGRVPEVEHMDKMVGLFTNSLPVRLTYDHTDDVKDWFKGLQKKLVRLRRHEHITLQQISQWSQIPVDYMQTIINTRSLVYTNFPFQMNLAPNGAGQKILQADSIGQLHLPLRLFVNPDEERFTLRMEYDRSRYDDDYIAQLLLDVKHLIAALPHAEMMKEVANLKGEGAAL